MRRPLVWLAVLTVALMGVRAASMIVVAQPGYTDAYYFADVAGRVARGQGLTADFVWNFLEAPRFVGLPVASHRFYMPLATLIGAAGIALAGGPLGDFRAAQLPIVAIAAAIPLVTYAAARSLGGGVVAALVAAAVAGLGGALAPGWVSLDAFAPAALLGTCFFIAFGRAARGSVTAGAAAGALVGLLYLARPEAALFGVALLGLAARRASMRAGVVGSAIALVFGIAWLARTVALGAPDDLLPRVLLLVRYEDLYALHPPTLDAFLASPGPVLGQRASALALNAATAGVTLVLVPLIPLAFAARVRWATAEVRAFVGLLAGVYLAQSLLFAPHAVRGSFFHSISLFFPFAVALAATGSEEIFAASTAAMRRIVWGSAVAMFAAITFFSLAQWDVDFNTPYRARVAALSLLPPGPLVAIDAPAWRWISGRETIVAPSDGPSSAACAAQAYGAATLVLEPAHFTRYDDLYASQRDDFFTRRAESGGIRIYARRTDALCVFATAE